MQKLFLCALLMFISCNNNTISTSTQSNVNHYNTLAENEGLIYDNYRTRKKHMNIELSETVNNLHSGICVTSCVTKPLQIAIVPMNASSSTTIGEIKNTIAMLKFSTSYSKYEINIIEGVALVAQSLIAISPDIIIGPFDEKDLSYLRQQMHSNKINAKLISLTSKDISDENVYNFGYKANANIVSIINYAKKMNYKNFIMFAPNNEIGGKSYKIFSEIAKNNKQEISRVEFYEQDLSDINKYIARLKNAAIETYYQNTKTGKIQKDDFNFTSKITSTEDGIITHQSGERFYKKSKKIDAIIIDASAKDLKKIYEAIANEDSLKNIPLIGSPRIADGILEMIINEDNIQQFDTEILFPASWEQYRNHYEIYKNTFNNPPTRLSTTIYETLQYILKTNQVQPIEKTSKTLFSNITIDGINGKMIPIPENNTINRTTDINSFKNGTVNQINIDNEL